MTFTADNIKIVALAKKCFSEKNYEKSKQYFELFFHNTNYHKAEYHITLGLEELDYIYYYICCLCEINHINIYENSFYDYLNEQIFDIKEKLTKKIKLTEHEKNVFSMKIYSIHEILKWGKYSNVKIEEIIIKDPNYILWCIINIDHFSISTSLFLYDEVKFCKLYYKALEMNLIKIHAQDWKDFEIDLGEKSTELEDDYGEYNDEYNFKYGFDGNDEAWDCHNQ
ncbi:exodeoxyribonuclease X C-terminal domain-containing protein [Flavobacterium psychrophilum]|uniref:exodeoxyribonuclease X C-terminal domain-containing protein n=1 Tax=Flavobacterium psychrophilum TaxID=96345 RepID=UPI001D09296C|nr:hypothetical protein [Flavobacterium psychrophilum]MCB6099668.1 hypothetical protein [Flavobacterium psychrophilum]